MKQDKNLEQNLDKSKTLSIYDDLQLPLGSVSRSYLVKFVDPLKEYDVDYLAPHQSRSGNREEGIFTLKGEELTEKQILQLFLREAL